MAADPLRSARRRLTAAAVAVVLLVLVVTAVVLVVVQRAALTDALDDGLRQRAADVFALIRTESLPAELGVSDDAATQVFVDGELAAASPNVDDEPPLQEDDGFRTLEVRAVDDDPVRVLSVTLGDVTVHVAAGADDIDESVGALAWSLAVAVPLLTAALGAASWWLVGRTLRPATAAAERERRFVADAAHELRSPLTRMRTELEVDLTHPARADPLATHRSVLEEVVGLQRTVDDLLQLARGASPAREPVDLVEVARRHAEHVGGAGTALIVGDRAALDRAVSNLVDNARRYAASRVEVAVTVEGATAVLTVDDDGPGIPDHERGRVFDRFARLDDSRSASTGGAGLGLAIVREVAAAHGGTVEATASPLGGARVVVRLPTA
jgi:signal transduction histidine kinase